MTERKASISDAITPILAGATTNGTGGITVPVLQRGTSDDAGATAWAFATDGTDGRIQVTLGAGVASQRLFFCPTAQSGSLALFVRAISVNPTTVELIVYSPSTGAAVNLATGVIAVQLVAHPV